MVLFKEEGIYFPAADLYIDPWKPVQRAVITHGHSDHARPGMGSYLCHPLTKEILRYRLGPDIQVQTLDYNVPLVINGATISFHPAGHIIGSAQVRLEYKGEVWVITGDYKLNNDLVSTPYEPVQCHSFLTESTFGLPVYQFQPCATIYEEINHWCAANARQGLNSVLIGYALGKSQNILANLDPELGVPLLHGAVFNMNEALAGSGICFPGEWLTPETPKERLKNAVIIAPQSVLGSPWLRKLQPYRIAVCSGWMALRGPRRRLSVDKGFALSDHCDFEQLNTAIKATGAENVYVTHGYQAVYSKWLCEAYGLRAVELKTQFDSIEETLAADSTNPTA
ncbi:DNA ligase-associated DEXH box helicase [Niabella ginsenosidivorans]|uniref:DNA ligase-associated DEXH box helicase n=1 Tax=Niabella ginsenosidivorans TaxID=1176587 RepID=A0A1A9I9K9_9BACT|nr:ligase-associated DNA damage response exonuclease [Niabella ginsenosidivorans]ANH84045.1 DNA ligase-associated DEXH box helicase [Niabella ginsenosidivorans]